MSPFFEGREQFDELKDALPLPWQVIELEEELGVTFMFPTVDGIKWSHIGPQIAEHFQPDNRARELDVGIVPRWQGPDNEDRRTYIAVDIHWPVPDDIIVRLQQATELIVDTCLREGLTA